MLKKSLYYAVLCTSLVTGMSSIFAEPPAQKEPLGEKDSSASSSAPRALQPFPSQHSDVSSPEVEETILTRVAHKAMQLARLTTPERDDEIMRLWIDAKKTQNHALLTPIWWAIVRDTRDPSYSEGEETISTRVAYRAMHLASLKAPERYREIQRLWNSNDAQKTQNRAVLTPILWTMVKDPQEDLRADAIFYLWNSGDDQQAHNRKILRPFVLDIAQHSQGVHELEVIRRLWQFGKL